MANLFAQLAPRKGSHPKKDGATQRLARVEAELLAIMQAKGYTKVSDFQGKLRDGWDDDVGDGVSLKWEIARVLLIVGLVLGAVMGVAWWLGQMVDAQDVEEALG